MSSNLTFLYDDSNMPSHFDDTVYTTNGVLVFKDTGYAVPLDRDPSITKDDSTVTNVTRVEYPTNDRYYGGR